VIFWDTFSRLGLQRATQPYLRRSITLSNRLAAVLTVLTLILFAVIWALSGFTEGVQRMSYVFLVYLAVPFLNHYGWFTAARLLVSCFVPAYVIWLVGATNGESAQLVYTASYFPPRIVTMATCTIPFFVFDTIKERKWLIVATCFTFACSMGYDFLISLFGLKVGLYERTDLFVYYNSIFFVHFLMISVASFLLKRAVDQSDNENLTLLAEKDSSNQLLKEKNDLLAALNHELETQNEEIKGNQIKLEAANQIIGQQKEQLHQANQELEHAVEAKSKELVDANRELSKYNSELRQFSYTVSHNLRAPVARLLGLSNLIALNRDGLNDEQKQLFDLLARSAQELDVIIRDLNKIIDIRNDIYRIREKISFEEEFDRVRESLIHQIPENATIQCDFSNAPVIYLIRPLLNSVLFNLTSNAIKYRSPNRPLRVEVKTYATPDYIHLEFADNGVGMNLELFRRDLFGMYKRFHTHTDGKGLGLFLVKSQIDIMGGSISVESSLNKGTTFKLSFKNPDQIEGQICYESEYGIIHYNARTNVMGISWKKQVTSEAYRALFIKCLETLRTYNTPYWISDLRKQGIISPADQKWMLSEIFVSALGNGLRLVAAVYDPQQHNEDYRTRIQAACQKAGIEIVFFTSGKEAEAWIETDINRTQV
jgi:signal transduction histidine kinase